MYNLFQDLWNKALDFLERYKKVQKQRKQLMAPDTQPLHTPPPSTNLLPVTDHLQPQLENTYFASSVGHLLPFLTNFSLINVGLVSICISSLALFTFKRTISQSGSKKFLSENFSRNSIILVPNC